MSYMLKIPFGKGVYFHQNVKDIKSNLVTKFWHAHRKEFWKGSYIKSRRGRPRWYQTLHRLAPPCCPKKNLKNIVTPDMWRLTPDTWHMTFNTWHVTHCWGWTFSQKVQLPSFYGLGFMMLWRYGGKSWLT